MLDLLCTDNYIRNMRRYRPVCCNAGASPQAIRLFCVDLGCSRGRRAPGGYLIERELRPLMLDR